MTRSRATLVVVPRERWSFARRSLASIKANTETPHQLVYVDAGSPAPLRHALAADVGRHGYRLLRVDEIQSPTHSRNLGARLVDTEYTVFIDNDVVVEPGWLDRLIACADETGAWLVGPLYCMGWPPGRRIHMASGVAHFGEDGRFVDYHMHYGESRAAVAPGLRRTPCEQVEFHCMLARTDALARLLPLDEAILSLAEHTDLCLRARAAGGSIWFEPAAVVTYVVTRWLSAIDLPFHELRWSDAWNRRTIERFAAKWQLGPDDPWRAGLYEWGATQRVMAFARSKALRVAFGPRRGYALAIGLDRAIATLGGGRPWGRLGSRARRARNRRGQRRRPPPG